MCLGSPDFLAIDQIVIIMALGTGLQGCQIRTGIGLGVPLTPEHFTAADAGQPAILLLRRAEGIKHRAYHGDPERAGRWSTSRCALKIKNISLRRGPAGASILLRPGHCQPALLSEQALPALLHLLARHCAAGAATAQIVPHIRFHPLAYSFPNRQFFVTEFQVHTLLRDVCSRTTISSPASACLPNKAHAVRSSESFRRR